MAWLACASKLPARRWFRASSDLEAQIFIERNLGQIRVKNGDEISMPFSDRPKISWFLLCDRPNPFLPIALRFPTSNLSDSPPSQVLGAEGIQWAYR